MTNEQLAAAVQAGEADRLAELWAQVERFVAQQANRRFASLRGVEFDDLYNTGFLAVHAAAQTYDPARGMSFIGWLELALRTAFAEAGGYRSRKQGKDPLHRAGSLDAPISEDDDTTLGELQADPSAAASLEAAEHRIWCAQLRGVLDRALDSLPEECSSTLKARYYQGMSVQAVAERDGVEVKTVRQRTARGLHGLHNPRWRAQLRQFVERQTPYYLHVGVERFASTRTSAVEKIVLRREEMEKQGRECI